MCVVNKKHPNRSKGWHKVGTLSFRTSVLNKCHERAAKWADGVLRRLSISIDLVTSGAIYHGNVNLTFLRKNVYLQQMGQKLNTRLEAADNALKSNFEKLCKWLDEQTELFTVGELHAKMCSFAEKDQNVYSLK